MVVLARREVDGGGGSAERGGRRWLCSPVSMLRRVPAAFDRVYNTSERRGRFWWCPNKQWGSGMAWPRRARACRRQWRAADGEMGSGCARGLGARFIGGKERKGELGASLLGEGSPGGGAHGRGSSAGRRRGERTDGGCAWRAQMVPRGGGFGKTRGARGGLGLGLGTCPSRWPAPAYGVAGGRGAGRRRWKKRSVAIS
jgi:hypothetical protein